MSKLVTLADVLYHNIEKNQYLNEIYDNLLHNYAVRLFGFSETMERDVVISDALRFADLLSKSVNSAHSEAHKSLAQEIVTILHFLCPDNPTVTHYLGSVLANSCNYRGMVLETPDYVADSIFDQMYDAITKEYLTIPADPQRQFFRSQKMVYDRLSDPYFSYSGPTSMGKSYVMRMFIKDQIQQGHNCNFAIVVPTKALINEVTSDITNELRDLLRLRDYRIVSSAGAVILKEIHNFIFIMTPERMQYLLSAYKELKIDYLFIDEAHKISIKEKRSAFYYTIVDRLSKRDQRPHIIFSSPNIPNPEVYLQLIPGVQEEKHFGLSSTYTPVSQMKFMIDFTQKRILRYNPLTKALLDVGETEKDSDLYYYLRKWGVTSKKSIVYSNSKDDVISQARAFSDMLPQLHDKDLDELADDIENEIHSQYYLAQTLRTGVAYHMGYLPSTIRLRIESMFKRGKIHTMFCTSTLLEGVNLPADNLFITHYKNGRRQMDAVEFKNLVGRVGRIQYNLYGNVFFMCLQNDVVPQKYVDLLKQDVPRQTLSISTLLTEEQKSTIIDQLKDGELEFEKGTLKVEEYALMRRFANQLLHDILTDKESRIRDEFKAYLTADSVAAIKNHFLSRLDHMDEDINVSLTQTERLIQELSKGAKYPRINMLYGNYADFEEAVSFLEMLCSVFDWEKQEKKIVGTAVDGKHRALRKHAYLLSQWFQGKSLREIVTNEISFKQNNGGTVYFEHPRHSEEYDGSPRHQNQIIADTLNTINEVILFSFSNAFMTFTSEYKRFHDKESITNDWYEFVEYGSTSPITIMLERNGFSREAATFIKDHEQEYLVHTEKGYQLLPAVLSTGNATVDREAAEVNYNIPELFI